MEIIYKIKNAIEPIWDDILDAYEKEYAPMCEDCGQKAQLDRSKVDLIDVLDMAQCLLIDFKSVEEAKLKVNAELRKI